MEATGMHPIQKQILISFLFVALTWLLFRKRCRKWEGRFGNKLKSVDFGIIGRCCWKNRIKRGKLLFLFRREITVITKIEELQSLINIITVIIITIIIIFSTNINYTGQQNFMTKMLLGNGHMFLGYFFKLISNLETIFLYQV